jgi:hypothetical protein
MRQSTVVRDDIVHEYEFDSELATRLFGSDDAVLELFTVDLAAQGGDPRVAKLARLAAARRCPP